MTLFRCTKKRLQVTEINDQSSAAAVAKQVYDYSHGAAGNKNSVNRSNSLSSDTEALINEASFNVEQSRRVRIFRKLVAMQPNFETF